MKAIAKARPKLPRMADHGSLVELGEGLIAHGAKRVEEDHMPSAAAVRDGCMLLFQLASPIRRANFEGLRLAALRIESSAGLTQLLRGAAEVRRRADPPEHRARERAGESRERTQRIVAAVR